MTTAIDADGTGLLDTPGDWSDVGYGWGVCGNTVGEMMQGTRREVGCLKPWQVDALLAGHAAGVADRAEFCRDMAAGADVVTGEDVPF
jgi:hypothetical protein